ncbi:hypothetical protein PRK78_000644 [Emydomyces testavorans]|uniref:Uncharacterized protein n=1 Tax=Emydomyces testavorans TaxID=2070801 RepID=A0AAF0DBI5_9EURO|nr:hypothetical protein PRK78_000644 [Emydomyces testavorans]
MSGYKNSIPGSQLALLLKGPTVKISYAASKDDKPAVIYEAIPKAVVKHFSSVLDDCFPSEGKHHVHRMGCDGKTSVIIYGGLMVAYAFIVQWMISCCQCKYVKRINRLDFVQYARIHEAAMALGVPVIQKEMSYRMDKMSNGQIPIEDVKIIYANFPKNSLPRQAVIRSIGQAILERRLRRWNLYKEFKLECIEYDNDIYDYVEERKRADREAGMAAEKDRNKNQSKKNGVEYNKESNDMVKEAPQVVTKTVQGVVARKGRKGQPTYVRVGLGDFGVSSQQFVNRGRGHP